MSSGCRLLRQVLQAGGVNVLFDHSHGTEQLPESWEQAPVIVIVRNATATRLSQEAAWAGWTAEQGFVPYFASIRGLTDRHQDAFWLTYEELCDSPDRIIGELADHLGLEPWPCPVAIRNQNPKWFARIGGPQIGPQILNRPGVAP